MQLSMNRLKRKRKAQLRALTNGIYCAIMPLVCLYLISVYFEAVKLFILMNRVG